MIYKDFFLNFLKEKNILLKITSLNKEIMTYCPFCEGITGKNHGHLYISTLRPFFYCHRCGEKGILVKLLKQFDTDFSLKDIIKSEYQDVLKDLNSEYTGDFKKYSSTIANNVNNETLIKEYLYESNIIKDERSKDKLDYLVYRTGMNEDSILKLPGLILNLNDSLKKALCFRYSQNTVDLLDKHYVGFLTKNGGKCVFRYCGNADDKFIKRYYSLKLIDLSFNDFYLVSNNTLKSTDVSTFVMAEGVFDIICSYNKLDVFSNIFDRFSIYAVSWCSVLGKTFYFSIVPILCLMNRCSLCNICILSDSDVDIKYYYKFFNYPFINRLFVLYCKNNKDFGNNNISIEDIDIFCLDRNTEKKGNWYEKKKR